MLFNQITEVDKLDGSIKIYVFFIECDETLVSTVQRFTECEAIKSLFRLQLKMAKIIRNRKEVIQTECVD
jgi:hypothetical protein